MGALTESEKIEREIQRIYAHGYMGPYRKGIVEGLRRRGGDRPRKCPYDGARSAKSWSEGVANGLKRSLYLFGDDDHPDPTMRVCP